MSGEKREKSIDIFINCLRGYSSAPKLCSMKERKEEKEKIIFVPCGAVVFFSPSLLQSPLKISVSE